MNLDDVFSKLIDQMAHSGAEWTMPWHGTRQAPLSIASGKAYTGINRLVLWARTTEAEFRCRYWGTFGQWRRIRQPVGFGQKGTVLLVPIIRRSAEGRDELHGFRTFHVFNGDQVLNRDETHPDLFGDRVVESESVDTFVRGTGARIHAGGEVAAYYRQVDCIRIPPPGSFFATTHSTPTQNYYSTLLHELVHWSGHPARQDRNGPFETVIENYAFEELVAEVGAAFLCSDFGLEDVPRADHAQYLNAWLAFIRDKPANLWRASALAQRAVNYLRNAVASDDESDDSTPSWFEAQPTQIDMLAPMVLSTGGRR